MAFTSKTQTTLGGIVHAADAELRHSGVGQEDVPTDNEVANDLDFNATWPNDNGFTTIREECHPIVLDVEGKIPRYVAGSLVRNGPSGHEVKDEAGHVVHARSHWFDGFSQLHKFDITHATDGTCKVTYRSRIQVDRLLQLFRERRRYSGYTFAQKRDPCQSLFSKFMTAFTPAQKPQADFSNMPVTVSSNTAGLGPRTPKDPQVFIARTDESSFKTVDAETLEPIGIANQRTLHPLLTGPMSASHAKSDPDTGDVFNYNMDIGYKTVYRVFRTSASTGETEILATISSPETAPAYLHSFFLSANFIILCVWNSHLAAGGMKVLWESNVLDAMATFDSSKPARWFVIDRRHGRGVVAKYESPALFAFHTINAWEEEREDNTTDIICDMIEYDDLDVLHKFYYDNIRSLGPGAAAYMRERNAVPHFARYSLEGVPLSSHVVAFFSMDYRSISRVKVIPTPIAGEIPTMNMAYSTRPYRYVYSCISRSLSTFNDGLAKMDVINGTSVLWDGPQGHTPSEAIFVADPGGSKEDDGVLLTIVLDGFGETSYLLCLDARNMQELGRADCKGPLPITFHGFFGKRDPAGALQRSMDA